MPRLSSHTLPPQRKAFYICPAPEPKKKKMPPHGVHREGEWALQQSGNGNSGLERKSAPMLKEPAFAACPCCACRSFSSTKHVVVGNKTT